MTEVIERKVVKFKIGTPPRRLARTGDIIYFGLTPYDRRNARVWGEINEGREGILTSTEVRRNLDAGLFDIRALNLKPSKPLGDAS